MRNIFYTRHDSGLTLMKDGKQSTVSNTHPNFSKILDALKNAKFEEVEKLMSIKDAINSAGISKKFEGQRVYVDNGKVFYIDSHKKSHELHGALVNRIIDDLGKPSFEKYADALLAFLNNIMKNKLKDIREELYEFLMSGKTPITYDGCFLAYKKVRFDYFDIFTGKMNNAPGEVVMMPQAEVDTNRNNECSRGLHFASIGYLSKYRTIDKFKIVIVKVNPCHVFAIPRDYNCQKGRASEYFVVGEYKSKNNQTVDAFKDSFIDENSKEAAAPEVVFEPSLKPSLLKTAEAWNLVKNGKARIITRATGEKVVVDWSDPSSDAQIMSFETKSVRAAIKAKIAELEKS